MITEMDRQTDFRYMQNTGRGCQLPPKGERGPSPGGLFVSREKLGDQKAPLINIAKLKLIQLLTNLAQVRSTFDTHRIRSEAAPSFTCFGCRRSEIMSVCYAIAQDRASLTPTIFGTSSTTSISRTFESFRAESQALMRLVLLPRSC